MNIRFTPSLLTAALLGLLLAISSAGRARAAAIPVKALKRTTPVDFEKEVLPILRSNCLACHNKTKAKADLLLETPKDILKGGDSGPSAIPGKGAESLIVQLSAHQDEDSIMPPQGNKVQARDLTPEELGLIKLWIDQGATGEVLGASKIEWQALPPDFAPIYSVALTRDGHYVACGRANRIYIYHVPSGRLVTELVDPALVRDGPYKGKGAAHLDMVNSLTFSPDGSLLASGGYREIKLWRRPLGVADQEFSMAKAEVRSTAMSPDGMRLAVGASDGSLRIINLGDGKAGNAISAHSKAVADLAWAPSGAHLASVGEDGRIRVWTASGAAFCEVQSNSSVRALAWAGKEPSLISAGDDKLIRLWKLPDAAAVAAKARLDQAEAAAVKALETAVKKLAAAKNAPAGKTKAVAAAESEAKQAQTNWEKAVAEAVKADKAAATASDEAAKKQAQETSIAAKKQVDAKLAELEARKKAVKAAKAELASSTKQLETAEAQMKSAEKAAFKAAAEASAAAMGLLKEIAGHAGAISSLAVNLKDPNQLVAGDSAGSVRVWDLQSGKTVRELKAGAPVIGVAIRGDGARAVTLSKDKPAKLWNLADGKMIAELNGDRRDSQEEAEATRTVAFGKAEVAYHKSQTAAAEKRQKAEADRSKKAAESVAAKKKAAAEKKAALETAKKEQAAAEKALADLKAEIKKITDAFNAATAAQKQAEASAKALFEKSAAAKLAADGAEARKAAAEKANQASMAAAKKNPGDAALAAAAKTAKTAADAAAADAAAKRKAAEAAAAAAVKAVAEVGSKGFAAGQLKPEFDRVSKEAGAKTKAAEAKVAEAAKKVASAEPAASKADDENARAENELKLARAAEKRESEAVSTSRKAVSAAEAELKKMEAQLAAAKSASAKPPAWRSAAFSTDGVVTLGSEDGRAVFWSSDTGAPLDATNAHSRRIVDVAWDKSGRLITGGVDGRVSVWKSLSAWSLERRIGTGDSKSPLVDRINALAFSLDGKTLASGGGEPSREGELKIWNVADGKELKSIPGVHSDSILDLQYSSDGGKLASSGADRFVKVIDVASGKVVNSFEGHTHHVLGVSWKRDGRTLASGGADSAIKVWDALKGARKKSIGGFSKEVTAVRYVDNKNYFFAVAGDSAARFVDENGKTVRSFGGAADFLHAADVTADAAVVAAGGQDGTLRVWNGADGKLKHAFTAPKP